jgi:hypothetical protein
MVPLEFFPLHNPAARTMAVGSTLRLIEYYEYFLMDKGGRRVGLTKHLYVSVVLKSGSRKLLEFSGPILACHRIVSMCFWLGLKCY